MKTQPEVIIVGAGPVGCAAALLLAARGSSVTLYETMEQLEFTDENSYPIGANPRGQESLRRIDSDLLADLHRGGERVDGSKIHAGTRVVVSLPSGTLIGTTRSTLTRLLMERCEMEPAITVVTGHALVDVDPTAHVLTFETSSEIRLEVDAADARVLCCDGVWSAARRAMEEERADFKPEVEDWDVQFRVIFSAPGAEAPDLDPA